MSTIPERGQWRRRWSPLFAILAVSVGLVTPVAAAGAAAVAGPVPSLTPAAAMGSGSKPSTGLDDLVNVAQIAGALATVIAVIVIPWQLGIARAAARKERTAALKELWDDRDFRKILSPVTAYLDAGDERDCVSKIRAWEVAPHAEDPCLPRNPPSRTAPAPSKNDVLHVLGFFEDLALLYNGYEVERDLVAKSIGPSLVAWQLMSLWFLHYYREARGAKLFGHEWETMTRNLRRGDTRSWWRRRRDGPHPVFAELRQSAHSQDIRVLCLPPGRESAFDADWLLAGRLARALASARARRSLAEHVADRAEQDPSADRWTIVLVPFSPGGSDAEGKGDRRLAAGLSAQLGALRDDEFAPVLEELERVAATARPA